ncbi:MAG: LysM peptidoglycan-binding domain-containing protein, partial [Anaerolineae bacterium]|nr:LysM peptidoglycan-binding domain-containing protein [Anaerolineae bacterium]
VSLSGDGSSVDSAAYGGGGYGGYGGYGYSGGHSGGWSGYYGWACAPRYDWAYSYVVHYGDTLANIAWRAGSTWQELAAGNCIPYPDYIYAGQYLRVPNPVSYYPPYPPHYPPYPYPPYPYPPYPYPTPVPTGIPPTSAPPPVVIGSALTFAPYDEINNNTVILPPDTLITISWVATFPTAATQVTFELIPPGGSSGTPLGSDSNLGDGAAITWYATAYTQGTVRAYATFSGGYAPQYSDSYYIIAGFPP